MLCSLTFLLFNPFSLVGEIAFIQSDQAILGSGIGILKSSPSDSSWSKNQSAGQGDQVWEKPWKFGAHSTANERQWTGISEAGHLEASVFTKRTLHSCP
jgi:hypothetical protein